MPLFRRRPFQRARDMTREKLVEAALKAGYAVLIAVLTALAARYGFELKPVPVTVTVNGQAVSATVAPAR